MSNYHFSNWLETKLSESHEPKAGDKAYFGIHDLMRNSFTPGENEDKIGEIVDVDPINEKIKVVISKDPFHLGYHRLESSKDRQKRKKMSKDDKVELMIPAQNFKDISALAGSEGAKMWLVVDRNTKYQQGLNKKLNKYMHKAPEPEINPQDVDDVQYMQSDSGYRMQNREVVPVSPNMPQSPLGQLGWKRHNDERRYARHHEEHRYCFNYVRPPD